MSKFTRSTNRTLSRDSGDLKEGILKDFNYLKTTLADVSKKLESLENTFSEKIDKILDELKSVKLEQAESSIKISRLEQENTELKKTLDSLEQRSYRRTVILGGQKVSDAVKRQNSNLPYVFLYKIAFKLSGLMFLVNLFASTLAFS